MDRAALLAAMEAALVAHKPAPVEVPAWGGTVYVRVVSVADVEEAGGTSAGDKRHLSRSVARVLCDESGVRVFDPSNEDDVAFIGRQPWAILKRVIDAADKANGLDAGAVESAGNG